MPTQKALDAAKQFCSNHYLPEDKCEFCLKLADAFDTFAQSVYVYDADEGSYFVERRKYPRVNMGPRSILDSLGKRR